MSFRKKMLLTWIGATDLRDPEQGPVATLLNTGDFDLVHYLYTLDFEAAAGQLMKRLAEERPGLAIKGHSAVISPVDHKAIHDQVSSVLRMRETADRLMPGRAAVNVTSGTPAMASVMLYLGRVMGLEVLSVIEAKYAAGPEDRVRPVDWDFGPELRRVTSDKEPGDGFDDFINLKKDYLIKLKILAPQECGILIEGETGVGKTRLAQYIHKWSGRSGKFVDINCADYSGVDLNSVKSGLLGHTKGAFTGADKDHIGAFLVADGGTLFLDEVGELAPAVQSFLLKTIEEKIIRRLGENKTQKVDVKIITATNRDLIKDVRAGKFRADLYYRLSDFPVTMSPLRELSRPAREKFIERLMGEMIRKKNLTEVSLSQAALNLMAAHGWPGNIRQLKQSLARLLLMPSGPEITEDEVKDELGRPSPENLPPAGELAPWEGRPLNEAVDIFRYQKVQAALARHGGKKSEAANFLGVSLQTLNNYLKEGRRLLEPGEG